MTARSAALRVAVAASGAVLVAGAAVLPASSNGTFPAVMLAAGQALGLGVWLVLGRQLGRSWATANAVTGLAWVVLFLVPSAVYAVAPRHLAGLDVAGAVAVVNVSLFALAAGYAGGLGRRTRPAESAQVRVAASTVDGRRAAGWFLAGLAGLGILMANAGGPREYLENLESTAGLNAGLFYVVWLSLCLRFAPTAVALLNWSADRPLGRVWLGTLALGIALLLLTGARAFVAVGLVHLLLAHALVRRRPSMRVLGPIALVVGVVLVFGVGAVKRHQTYNTQHPEAPVSLGTYLVEIAPGTTVEAYVNNYVDTVRLVAMARDVVPRQAGYEGVRPFLELVLKPIPSPVRPDPPRDRDVRRVFEPPGPYVYAEPLQATMYLAGGPLLVAAAFALLGFGIARLDRWLARDRRRSPAAAAAAIAVAVQTPVLLRSGLPNGAAFLGVEVLGAALVTWHVAGGSLRRLLPARRPGSRTRARSRRLRRADRVARQVPPALALGMACVLVLALAGHAMGDNPALGQDSAGYLANARALTGAGVTPQHYGTAYAVGYSLLLAPPYAFTTSVTVVHHWAVGVNVACVALAGWAAWTLATEWFGLSRRRAAVVAGMTAVVPVLALGAGTVLATCAVVAAFLWWAVWLVRAHRRRSPASVAACAALAVTAYATHHTTAPAVAATAVLLLAVGRSDPRSAIAGGMVLAAGVGAAVGLEAWVHGQLGVASAQETAARRVLGFEAGHLESALARTLGTLWAMTVTTVGLAAAGAWTLASRRRDRLPTLLVVAAAGGIVAVGSVFLTAALDELPFLRVDTYAYERYAAPATVLFAVAGAAALLRGRPPTRVGAAAAVLLGAATVAALSARVEGAVAVINVPGVSAIGTLVDRSGTIPDSLDFGAVALVGVALAVAAGAAQRRGPGTGVAAAVVAMTVLTVAGTLDVRGYNRYWDDVATATPAVLERVPLAYPVAYDAAALGADYLNRFQMLEPRRRWLLFDSRASDPPPSGLVVAAPTWPQAARHQAVPVVAEADATQVLWRLGSVPEGVRPAPPWPPLLGRASLPGRAGATGPAPTRP